MNNMLTQEEKDAMLKLAESKAKNPKYPTFSPAHAGSMTTEVTQSDPETLKLIESAQRKEQMEAYIKARIQREAALDAKLGRFEDR